ncbi:MAG: DUF4276 family protein [Chlamydiae bacterium]|nr:DUF4276 family protein [Chlamydiota bacterium]
MIRLGIIGEGVSEEAIASQIISPYLSNLQVFARQIVTKRRASEKDCKGGMPAYERVKKDILSLIKEDSGRFVTTMFDLYALPRDFPGYSAIKRIENPYEKVKYLEEAFAKDISSKRFIPYIQLYELEALFFADIEIIHRMLSLNNPQSKLKDLEKIVKAEPNPEFINDGPSTAPSKRIIRFYPDYQKSVDALRILKTIGLPMIREKCSHFDVWLTKLESLSS